MGSPTDTFGKSSRSEFLHLSHPVCFNDCAATLQAKPSCIKSQEANANDAEDCAKYFQIDENGDAKNCGLKIEDMPNPFGEGGRKCVVAKDTPACTPPSEQVENVHNPEPPKSGLFGLW